VKLSRIFLLCLFSASLYGQATAPQPTYNQATTPTSCRFGDTWFKPGVTPGLNLYGCTSPGQQTPGTWTLLGDGGGSGGGDFSSNTSTSVDSEIVLFSGTAGKTGKRATQTGVLKGSSGALGVVAGSGSDCVHVDATSATCPTGSGFANPMTTPGDMIVGGSSGTATRLAKGADGQVLTLVSGAEAWAAAGGGGTVGFAVTRTSATVLTISPGNASCGGIVYTFGTSLTLTITGTMSIANLAYDCAVSPAVIRVYADTTNATLVGTGAGSVVGSTTIPATSFKFYQWTASSSNWDALGGADYRAQLAGMTFTAHAGLIVMPNPTTGNIDYSLDSTLVPTTAISLVPLPPATFSPTPIFSHASGSIQSVLLTGNVTSSTFTNGITAQDVTFHICQDATGSRTFVWPTTFHGTMTIGSTASKCNDQTFWWDGAAAWAKSTGITNQ
jgi:hypothetical protein